MRRIGYLYESMCDLATIKYAIKMASKGKTKRRYIQKVLKNEDMYARKLQKMLQEEKVVLLENTLQEIFDRSCLKKRIITVPKFFPDQIIHWLLILKLEPIMRKGMYRYSCGSVPARGGLEAKKYVVKALRDKRNRYVAKLDISKFFNNVDTKILLQMFERKVKDKRFLSLLKQVLDNGGKGLPIGYYTSQWFSNFYLEGLDHYIKEQLQVRYYVRYVDDMVLIDTNKRKLHKAVDLINQYLNTIKLKLKDNWQVWKIDSRPIDFVGFRFYRDRTMLRRRIYYRLLRRIRRTQKKGYMSIQQAMGILSLLGWLCHISNGYNFYKFRVYPYTPKNKLKKIVSAYGKKLNGGNQNGNKKESIQQSSMA